VCSEVAALQAARICEDRRVYLWLEVIGAVLLQSQELFLQVVEGMERAKVGLLRQRLEGLLGVGWWSAGRGVGAGWEC
jgi:hypothetical protein